MRGSLLIALTPTYAQNRRVRTGGADVRTDDSGPESRSLYGALSDRIGRRPVLLAFGVMGALGTVALLSTLQHAQGPWQAFFLVALGWIMTAPYTSINAVVKAELFPASLRATGIGLPYAVAVPFFGGTAEYVALWFKSRGFESGFYYYASAVIFCSLLVYFFLPDTRKTSLLDREAMEELE